MLRPYVSEALGTALLLIGVVGSGIMAQTMTGDTALALLGNAIATGAMLYVIITVLGPLSGAHFNPAVTLAFALRGEIPWLTAGIYVLCQIGGGIAGVLVSHAMFSQDIIQLSNTDRVAPGLWLAEAVATFGLLFVIFGGRKARPEAVPMMIAIYIMGAYFFTASTSFANPAVTIARTFTDSFAGIALGGVIPFILVQLVTVGVAHLALRWLFKST